MVIFTKEHIKTTAKQRVKFLSMLRKLTDARYNFSLYNHFENDSWSLRVDMLFCNSFVASANIEELNEFTAIEALKELVENAQDKDAYFKTFGVSFQVKKDCLNGDVKYMFRKSDESKFVNISKPLARALVTDKTDIISGMTRLAEISFCDYADIYYFNIRGDV